MLRTTLHIDRLQITLIHNEFSKERIILLKLKGEFCLYAEIQNPDDTTNTFKLRAKILYDNHILVYFSENIHTASCDDISIPISHFSTKHNRQSQILNNT